MDPQTGKTGNEYILDDLLRSRNRDDIIREVCWRTNCSWVEAEYLLERTERENKVVLRQEKSPIRMFISILAAALGLVWTVVSLIRLLSPYMNTRVAAEQSLQGYAWPAETTGLVIQTGGGSRHARHRLDPDHSTAQDHPAARVK